MVDLACSVGLALLLSLLVAAYVARLAFFGAASFERVKRDKGSVLFGTSAMQMGYWGLDPVGRALASLGITANSISTTSLLLGLGAAGALAVGHFGVAAVLAVVSALCDALDGMVARYTRTASDSGEVLDATIDRYVEFAFLGGLAIYDHDRPVRLVMALAAILGSFMVSYATAKGEAMAVDVPRGSMRRPERAVYLTFAAALCPVTALWASHGGPSWVAEAPMICATTLVAVVGNASAVRRLRAVARSLRGRDMVEATPLRKNDPREGAAPQSTKDVAGPSAPVTRTGPSEVRRAANG